jgi:hypothetical protein
MDLRHNDYGDTAWKTAQLSPLYDIAICGLAYEDIVSRCDPPSPVRILGLSVSLGSVKFVVEYARLIDGHVSRLSRGPRI